MIIRIRNEEGEATNYDINLIADQRKKTSATVMVNKVGNLQVILEALDFASRTHRANLEALLQACPEAKTEEPATETETEIEEEEEEEVEAETEVVEEKS